MKNYNLTFALGLIDLGRPLFKRGASADTELSIEAQRDMNRENNEFNAQQAQLTRDFDAEQAQINRDFQGQMQSQQMQWNEDMWNKQNEYNTPANQLSRASAAGINPNAIFGGLSSQAQAVGGVSGVSGAQASGPAASAASVPTVMGTSKFTQVLNALNSVLHDGSTVAEMLYGTDVKKANARLTNANAEAQEIQNRREKAYDESFGKGFAINSNTGEIKAISSLSETELNQMSSDNKRIWEPIILGSVGSARASADTSSILTKLNSDQLQRMKDSFEQTVQKELPNTYVELDGKQVHISQAIAKLPAEQVRNLIEGTNKVIQETKTSKSQEDVNSAQKRLIEQEINGDTALGKAVEAIDKEGFSGKNVVNLLVSGIKAFKGK